MKEIYELSGSSGIQSLINYLTDGATSTPIDALNRAVCTVVSKELNRQFNLKEKLKYTDTIEISLKDEDIYKLYALIIELYSEEWGRFIDKLTERRDGYIPFYKRENYKKLEEFDYTQKCHLLQFACDYIIFEFYEVTALLDEILQEIE